MTENIQNGIIVDATPVLTVADEKEEEMATENNTKITASIADSPRKMHCREKAILYPIKRRS